MTTNARVPTIAARLALPLVLEWKRRGRTVTTLLSPMQIDEAHLRKLDARIPLSLFSDLHAACTTESRDQRFALTALDNLDQAAFPPILHLVSSQLTLLDGVGFVEPFVTSMLDDLDLELLLRGEASRASFRRASVPLCPASFAEYFLAILWTFVRRVVPTSPPPLSVSFAHRWPRHGPDLGDFFGTSVHHGADHVGFSFRMPSLQLPITTADPELGRLLAANAERWRGGVPSDVRVRDRVRHFLSSHLDSGGSLAERAADALRMSPRSMRRKLLEEGSSLGALTDEVRRERAIELLESGARSLDAIALELGYKSASAFGRAFRAWTGRTPTDFVRDRAR